MPRRACLDKSPWLNGWVSTPVENCSVPGMRWMSCGRHSSHFTSREIDSVCLPQSMFDALARLPEFCVAYPGVRLGGQL